MSDINRVIDAASSSNKITFNFTSDVTRQWAEIDRLAHTFDRKQEGSLRQWALGGAERAQAVVTQHQQTITNELNTIQSSSSHPLPTSLVQSVMFLENNYNGGSLPFDKTPLPMNVNYQVWQRLFEDYNKATPIGKITEKTIRSDAANNIRAGVLILSTLNDALDPAITPPTRWALVASLYGHTEKTLENQAAIPYGGKVTQLMEARYKQLSPFINIAAGASPALMELSAPPAPASTKSRSVSVL